MQSSTWQAACYRPIPIHVTSDRVQRIQFVVLDSRYVHSFHLSLFWSTIIPHLVNHHAGQYFCPTLRRYKTLVARRLIADHHRIECVHKAGCCDAAAAAGSCTTATPASTLLGPTAGGAFRAAAFSFNQSRQPRLADVQPCDGVDRHAVDQCSDSQSLTNGP